jgi:hypothetical protein
VKIRTDDFRVREGDDVKLHKLPTVTDPVYGSTQDYQDLLAKHVLTACRIGSAEGRNELLEDRELSFHAACILAIRLQL